MEGTGTSATAMLVATPEDVGGRPDAATVTLAREEIEEALASDQPLDLILTVDRGTSSPQDVRVSWERSDLETVLAEYGHRRDHALVRSRGALPGARAGGLRGARHPRDGDDHGRCRGRLGSSRSVDRVRTAAGHGGRRRGDFGNRRSAGRPGDDPVPEPGDRRRPEPVPGRSVDRRHRQAEPGTIPYLSQGIGVDQSQFQGDASTAGTQAEPGTIPYLSQGIGVDQSQFQGDASTAGTQAEPGTIPYLSQGIGVDQSQFQGDATAGIHDEATLIARGVDPAIATAMASHGEAATASELAAVAAIHDESTLAARGVDQIVPGADEATLAARGIHTPAVHDEGTLVTRGIESPAVPADSGTSFEMPALDSGTAAAIGGLAGAGLLIVGAAFVARRRTTPAA